MTNDHTTPGPAYCAAAVPVSTKMPAPMIAPIPSRVRLSAPSARFSVCVPSAPASSCNTARLFVANKLIRLSVNVQGMIVRNPGWVANGAAGGSGHAPAVLRSSRDATLSRDDRGERPLARVPQRAGQPTHVIRCRRRRDQERVHDGGAQHHEPVRSRLAPLARIADAEP